MKRILLVEDDCDISDAIAACLEDRGYQVSVAVNGEDALAKLRESSTLPDLIVLDLMMPIMDGWQFRATQTADPALSAIPVVLLSAHVELHEVAGQMGAVDWLRKPVDLDTLLTVVGKAAS